MTEVCRRTVLHLINGEFYAGAERVQDLLGQRLGEQGFDVAFVALKDGIFAGKRQAQNVPLHCFPMTSRIDFSACRRIADLARAQRCCLLHTHTPRAALVGNIVARMAGVPLVHHVHSPAERDTEQGWRNLRNAFVERACLRGASHLIAVSGSLERHLRARGVSAARLTQVPNGVPFSEVLRLPAVAGKPFVFGVLALFRPRKGIEILLDALAYLRATGLDAHLHAVGPFETEMYGRTVQEHAHRLGLDGFVTWTGFQRDIAAEFARMHAFVLPSLFGEGMPMVVLEAMAAGLPVVGTRVEGIPEVVRHGRDGLLCDPGDAQSLASAMGQLARGEVDAMAMGDSGRERQRAAYSDIAMASGVASVYRRVLGR